MKNTLEQSAEYKKSQHKLESKYEIELESNANQPKKKRARRRKNTATIIPSKDIPFQGSNGINNEKQSSRQISETVHHSSERECLANDKGKEQVTQDIKTDIASASPNYYIHDEGIYNDDGDSVMWNHDTGEVSKTKQEPNLGTESCCSQPDSNGIFSCGQCGKTFKTKYTLSIHLKMPNHTEHRPFVCNVCGKGFRLSSTLCRHKIIHTDRKPYECPNCVKSFNRSSTLKTHMRTHSEQKAFVCEICGKGFHQKGNLRNHVFVHTGEKPFKCSKCNRAFNKMSNLKFHMHTHSDNMPYYCKTCRKRFLKKTELKQHMKVHS